jgi:hypothetical protein
MESRMIDFNIWVESITKAQLDEVERFADKLFAKLNIDVDLGSKHLFDRLNDARNGRPISTAEMVALFRKTFKKYGSYLKKQDDMEAVINDMNSDLNLPFILKWDAKNQELDLIAKTVMRKKDFKTSNKKLKV